MRDWLVPSSFHLSENKICEVNMIQGEFQENYGAMVVYGGGVQILIQAVNPPWRLTRVQRR